METWLTDTLSHLASGPSYYLAILLVALTEGIPVLGLFVPGSVLCISVGALAFSGHGNLPLICLAAACGAMIGDQISYLLGTRNGQQVARRLAHSRYHRSLRRAELFFAAHGGKSLFIARFLGPLRGFVPFIAGSLHMHPRRFLFYSVTSGLLWGLLYPLTGYWGGAGWHWFQLTTRHLFILTGLALLGGLVFWYRLNRKRS
ncbi:MAG: DedA family protein [Desulfuromonadaceae bacterium]|nr:DedA family protein [Desulfuromonadaceae bacterium]